MRFRTGGTRSVASAEATIFTRKVWFVVPKFLSVTLANDPGPNATPAGPEKPITPGQSPSFVAVRA